MRTVSEKWATGLRDMMTFYIKVDQDRLVDVKFNTFGCVAAIAVSSMVSEMAKGKPLDEAKTITTSWWRRRWEGCPRTRCTVPTWGRSAHAGHRELP